MLGDAAAFWFIVLTAIFWVVWPIILTVAFWSVGRA